MSAMRSPHGGFGWGVLVKVDERVAFALRFSWSRDAVVRFYGSAGRSKPVRGCRSIMGAGVGVRNAGTHKPVAQKEGTRRTNHGGLCGGCLCVKLLGRR